jgi:ankyrin repeat protein
MYPGVEMVELLLSKGANPDSLSHGGTVLHLAAIHGHDDIMKVLLDHHADVRATPVFSFL